MNIKVPYDKLEDISNCEFISFILDKNNQTIYRIDLLNDGKSHLQFFNCQQEMLTIPDEMYEQCDSIIFFPFNRSTKNWGTKVIMWKNEEFVKFNGGYEYVRNHNKSPNLKKIDEWLKKGKLIKKSKKIVGTKNLIYFTLFGNKDYVKLLRMLLTTLEKQKFKNFDFLFITDDVMKPEIEKLKLLKKYNVFFHVMHTIHDPVDASMQKLKIYEWKNVSKYKNILFLDVDILVVGNVGNIFNSKNVKPNVFYSATHNKSMNMHDLIYHTLIDYTNKQKANFTKKNISAFNAGQFFFKNTSYMKSHFENINKFIAEWDGRYFFEQSFINYYFNLLEISNTSTLDAEFKFVSINEHQINNVFDKNAVFVHFMGNAANANGKIAFMKKHYKKLLSR